MCQICVFFQMAAELSHSGDNAVNRGGATLNPDHYLDADKNNEKGSSVNFFCESTPKFFWREFNMLFKHVLLCFFLFF